MKRRFVVITLILCMLFQALAFTASAAVATKGYEFTDTSKVMDDLKNMLFDGSPFRESDYPINSFDDAFHVLRFLETGYNGTSFDDDAALYVYVYNPSAQHIVKDSDQNRITFKVDTGYLKHDLIYCNSSTDNRFLKYRVDIGITTLREYFKGNRRTYEVSEIELYQSGLNATSFKVGGEYVYSGSGDDLYCDKKDVFVIELDLTGTYYRPDVMSSGGADHRNELASVYFSVPNSVIEYYGGTLYSVQGEYYENEIATIVTQNPDYYDIMHPLEGTAATDLEGYESFTGGASNYPAIYSTRKDVTGSLYDMYWHSLNVASHYAVRYDELRFVPYTFFDEYVSTDKVCVTTEALKKRVEDVGLITLTGSPNAVKTTYDISIEDGYTLQSYASTHSDFETMIAKVATWWKQDLSTDIYIKSALVSVDYSEISKMTAERVSDYYYVHEDDVQGLRSKCMWAQVKDETVYLLRFAQNEVATYEMQIEAQDSGITVGDDQKTYLFTQPYYKDFDVLSLTFQDEKGEFVLVPVASSPTDIVGDIVLTDDIRIPKLPENFWMWIVAIFLILLLVIVLILIFHPALNTAFQDMSRSIRRGWQKLKSRLTPKKRQKKRTRKRKYSRKYRK